MPVAKEKQNDPLRARQAAVIFRFGIMGKVLCQICQKLWQERVLGILAQNPVASIRDMLQSHAAQLLLKLRKAPPAAVPAPVSYTHLNSAA